MLPSVPSRLHQKTLDLAGIPDWSKDFYHYLGGVVAPNWWQFEPITSHLHLKGYGMGLRIVDLLHDSSRPGIHRVCGMYHIKQGKASRLYRETWEYAYHCFWKRYPGVMRTAFSQEKWREVAYVS